MKPYIIIAIAAASLIAVGVIIYELLPKKSTGCNPSCVPPEVCVNGTCVTPACHSGPPVLSVSPTTVNTSGTVTFSVASESGDEISILNSTDKTTVTSFQIGTDCQGTGTLQFGSNSSGTYAFEAFDNATGLISNIVTVTVNSNTTCFGNGYPSSYNTGAVGSIEITSLPTPLPSNPTWVPCESSIYSLSATANYPIFSVSNNSGTGIVMNPSSLGVLQIVYTPFGDWVGYILNSDGSYQIYDIYSSTYTCSGSCSKDVPCPTGCQYQTVNPLTHETKCVAA